MTNPIIEEVRAARASIAADLGYDRTKILAWARAEQAALKMKNPNKTSIPTPDPPQVQSAIFVQPSTEKPTRAVGQA
ncbi:MAG: hypothetical protein H7Y36_03865 [Armatimonadetes bacterium]|nr:hypothetical protein [Akkermansiaceae bacterium]